ncbi:GlsB/YeaQ/YmgE family stress response membrane protein [Caenispirillum salinarum]|uniref:GlsB/YeaQ/YmgE family stress response membrane protein n=1 Tax=Caenispirillum salinarum TaxID=859058 RepID=UPI00384C526D
MGIIAWIVFGLIAGIVAKLLMPGRDPGGFIITILLGIAGALVGGFIARAIGIGAGVTGFNFGSFIIAVLGAILLLVIYRMVKGRKAR